ncbi:MAG: hypothetical protein MUC42_12535 [Bryobacter sp.]|nr:hypothetical protein [Bryobacter sp.]
MRKLIPRAGGAPPEMACLTESHQQCPGFVQVDGQPLRAGPVCPFLEESLAQYCGAAPVLKLIPYSEAMLLRCGSGAYRYCDLYLEQAGPALETAGRDEEWVAPTNLLYASHFWWIDLPEEGPWHAGLDAFAARLAGRVQRVSYILSSPGAPPAVVLTIKDREYTFDFPEALTVTASNPLLRLHPDRLWEAPYTRGWVYEGTATAAQRAELRARLSNSDAARLRMEEDAHLVNERIHQTASSGAPAMGDGGAFEDGLLGRMRGEDARSLMHALLSRQAPKHRN